MNDDAASLLFQSDALRRVGRPSLLATRDAIAEALHQAIRTSGPGIHCDRLADALLASGVLDAVRADAWDEGRWWWFTGDESAARGANPYRTEVSP